jgi:predicted ester cyclase
MSTDETRQLAQRYLDVLNRVLSTGDVDLLDGIATVDFIEHGSNPGLAAWKQNVAMSRVILPDGQLIARAILADGDKAAIHGTIRGTHLGEMDSIPPTGKEVAVEFIDIVRFQDSSAVERWMVGDEMGMMRQLGVIPAPGAGEA